MSKSLTDTGMVVRPTRINPAALARLLADEDAFPPGASDRVCQVCGCTDEDCRGCIARTGEPCFWIGDDLCSACASKGGHDG